MLRLPSDADGIFVGYLFVRFRPALVIVYVPAKSTEERIEKFTPQFRLVLLSLVIDRAVELITLDKIKNRLWCRHEK